jgi:membrane protein CcdC involved in cytochrome C biogenesis
MSARSRSSTSSSKPLDREVDGAVLMAAATPTGSLVLMTAVFLASAVEMVEALTIVLAVGVTRGWKSAFEGVVVALVALASLVVLFGPALVHYVPLSVLRLVVGGLLLVAAQGNPEGRRPEGQAR